MAQSRAMRSFRSPGVVPARLAAASSSMARVRLSSDGSGVEHTLER